MDTQANKHTESTIHTDDMGSVKPISPAVDALRSHVEKWYSGVGTAGNKTHYQDTDFDNREYPDNSACENSACDYCAVEGTDCA